jgi:hypothetical protein
VNTSELDELYFQWLYAQVESVDTTDPSRTYWDILRILHHKEFLWFVPNDDNRAEDARNLRHLFVSTKGIQDVDEDWMNFGCSMLELMVALAHRLSFVLEGEPAAWFWELMENIKLEVFNDNVEIDEQEVDEILNVVIWRTYSPKGVGGLFPLKKKQDKNQRDVELWYQMNAYILERTA